VPANRVLELRNWADLSRVHVLDGPSPYRAEWGIAARHVALYSGNIANKQGIGIIVEAARRLAHREDLLFLVCGEGPNRDQLVDSARGLPNIRFEPLQPMERLGDLVGLASVHLLPQLAGAADLVLPSKLTNMLASGRPIVATADPGTGIASEVEGCGILTPPGDADRFAAAINDVLDRPEAAAMYGAEARRRAEQRWSHDAVIDRLEAQFRAIIVSG
jgi:colanic acid biosynthesis glycosyl transferase WcaI